MTHQENKCDMHGDSHHLPLKLEQSTLGIKKNYAVQQFITVLLIIDFTIIQEQMFVISWK
ncbi:hypothetical protein ACOI1C_06240 [Bacillus sp. DJP31]|uniref:hypothetical protein n=1 Tax=Bacillus sp. DJP31 TaxID=3409789 RepID=UPI003BB778D5